MTRAQSPRSHRRPAGFLRRHALSLVVAAILTFLLVMYRQADKSTHAGAFYGNAIADWLGTLVFVVSTRYLFEAGSEESRTPPRGFHGRLLRFLIRHSLTIVLGLTGLGWVAVYARSDVNSKWGEVAGNVVSEWTQVLGLVLITKFAREQQSAEGGR